MAKRNRSSAPARLSYYRRHRKRILAQLRRKYRDDEAFRTAILERVKRRYHEDETYRQAVLKRAKERYRQSKA